ncbi:hypothetical protein K523DRAFT_361717 [Schizophyllum commune Tattone D]|nr:hypothetical protein K523DRAFT_361717 [Schizophyllum commune Tattone D]
MANLARKSKDAYVRQYEGYLDDLNTLKAELRNLLAPTSVASRRPALLKVKAILARGNAFRLLDEDFLRPDLPWEMDGFQVDVLMQAMSAYSLYIEVSSLPEYSSLRATKPMALADIVRWIDVVHPMNDRLVPTPEKPTYGTMVTSIAGLLSSITRKKDGDFTQLAWSDPHVLTLMMDLWLYYPRYLQHYSEDLTETATTITVSALATLENVSATEDGEKYFVTRLLDMVGGRPSRILRLIAEQTAFLDSINVKSRWSFVWKIHYALVEQLSESSDFLGVDAPLCFFESVVVGWRRCLEKPTDENLAAAAEEANSAVGNFVMMALSTTNLRRAIRAGVYDALFDVERAWGKEEKLKESALFGGIAQLLANSFTIPSILRTFHRRHTDLLHPPEKPDARRSFIEKRFQSLLSGYRIMWQQYTDARKAPTWKRAFPCSNVHADVHEAEVRACACGQAFYCSKKCQREHWKAGHRDSCCHEDGVWGFEGDITLDDAVFLFESALRVIKRNEKKMAKDLARTDYPDRPLIMVDLATPPTPDGNFEWTLDEELSDLSSDEDWSTDEDGGENEEDEADGVEANVAQDRDKKAENRRRHVDKDDENEGPHITAISVAYCVGEVYPDEELPFKRPRARAQGKAAALLVAAYIWMTICLEAVRILTPSSPPRKLVKKRKPGHVAALPSAASPAASSNDSFYLVTAADVESLAQEERRRSPDDPRRSTSSADQSSTSTHTAEMELIHLSTDKHHLRAPMLIEGKETRFHEHFSPRDSNTMSLTSANFPMLGSRPVSAETILPVPPPVRTKLGKEGSKFIERLSSASGSVRSAGARSEASSTALPVIVRGQTRVTSPTPSARVQSRPRSPAHSPVPSRPRSPAPAPSTSSRMPSPPKSVSKDGPPRRLRYADIMPEPIEPGPRASLALGLSAAQWRHSSQPPPEGYEYGVSCASAVRLCFLRSLELRLATLPASEQGTVEDFMNGQLLNPNAIRPIRRSADETK